MTPLGRQRFRSELTRPRWRVSRTPSSRQLSDRPDSRTPPTSSYGRTDRRVVIRSAPPSTMVDTPDGADLPRHVVGRADHRSERDRPRAPNRRALGSVRLRRGHTTPASPHPALAVEAPPHLHQPPARRPLLRAVRPARFTVDERLDHSPDDLRTAWASSDGRRRAQTHRAHTSRTRWTSTRSAPTAAV